MNYSNIQHSAFSSGRNKEIEIENFDSSELTNRLNMFIEKQNE
jgi:hypothetical protein